MRCRDCALGGEGRHCPCALQATRAVLRALRWPLAVLFVLMAWALSRPT